MHPHIRIRMAHKPLIMRDFHTAQHHMIAGAKGVHVKSIAGAYVHCALL